MKKQVTKFKIDSIPHTHESWVDEDGEHHQVLTSVFDLWIPADHLENFTDCKSQLNWTDEQKEEIRKKLGK